MLLDEAKLHFGTSVTMSMAFLQDVALHADVIELTPPHDLCRVIGWWWCGARPTRTLFGNCPGRGATPWATARQLLSMQGEIPSSVAIWIRGRLLLSSSATTSRLNSGVKPASPSSLNTFPLP
jgi:hypothetical protein